MSADGRVCSGGGKKPAGPGLGDQRGSCASARQARSEKLAGPTREIEGIAPSITGSILEQRFASGADALVAFAGLFAHLCAEALGHAAAAAAVDVTAGVSAAVDAAIATGAGDVAGGALGTLHFAATFRAGKGAVAALLALAGRARADFIAATGACAEAQNEGEGEKGERFGDGDEDAAKLGCGHKMLLSKEVNDVLC